LQGQYEELTGEQQELALCRLMNRVTPLLVSETSVPGMDIHQPVTRATLARVTYRIRIGEKSGRYEKW
jgi:nitroimidazol reductase NimA-like FMN-containing flavoprotein (pyridoxamine 5'-phosphate oxidase superfamily)